MKYFSSAQPRSCARLPAMPRALTRGRARKPGAAQRLSQGDSTPHERWLAGRCRRGKNFFNMTACRPCRTAAERGRWLSLRHSLEKCQLRVFPQPRVRVHRIATALRDCVWEFHKAAPWPEEAAGQESCSLQSGTSCLQASWPLFFQTGEGAEGHVFTTPWGLRVYWLEPTTP